MIGDAPDLNVVEHPNWSTTSDCRPTHQGDVDGRRAPPKTTPMLAGQVADGIVEAARRADRVVIGIQDG